MGIQVFFTCLGALELARGSNPEPLSRRLMALLFRHGFQTTFCDHAKKRNQPRDFFPGVTDHFKLSENHTTQASDRKGQLARLVWRNTYLQISFRLFRQLNPVTSSDLPQLVRTIVHESAALAPMGRQAAQNDRSG